MTLIEVIDNARNLLNESLDSTRVFPDDSSSFFTDTTLMGYFNLVQSEVQDEIAQTYEDYFLTATFLNITDGCATYTLPSGTMKVRRVEDVRNATPTEILPVTINSKEVRGSIFNIVSSSFERGGYYLAGQDLVLTNTPNFTNASAVKLWYTKKLANLTSATDTSQIPPEHHGILTWGIVKYALFQEQADTTKAEIEYEKRIARMKKNLENRQIQRPRMVKSRYRDDY